MELTPNQLKIIPKKFRSNDKGDESALFKHFFLNHRTDSENIGIDNAYKIRFLEQPELNSLDHKESL